MAAHKEIAMEFGRFTRVSLGKSYCEGGGEVDELGKGKYN